MSNQNLPLAVELTGWGIVIAGVYHVGGIGWAAIVLGLLLSIVGYGMQQDTDTEAFSDVREQLHEIEAQE